MSSILSIKYGVHSKFSKSGLEAEFRLTTRVLSVEYTVIKKRLEKKVS